MYIFSCRISIKNYFFFIELLYFENRLALTLNGFTFFGFPFPKRFL